MKQTALRLLILFVLLLVETSVVCAADAENSDVDAVSSASVISTGDPRGYPKFVADVVAERTGGTLFSIRTEIRYPGVYNTLADYARNEKESGTIPTLANRIDNFDDYDTFFIGYPIRWYTLPQVMVSFFEEYDFSGKTVIPFCTHYGSRSADTFERIAEFEPDATVKEGLYLHQNSVTGSESQILSWLDGLGYAETANVSAVTPGTQTQRGFLNDNVYHSETEGDIHYSSYIPADYDGSEPYALFITLPGWEGLYFQGADARLYGGRRGGQLLRLPIHAPRLRNFARPLQRAGPERYGN